MILGILTFVLGCVGITVMEVVLWRRAIQHAVEMKRRLSQELGA